MPLPIETLLRVHGSPVPTQTFFGFFGSSAIAPIDCTGCSSKTGRKRVPPSSDFQTPPLAAPTKMVSLARRLVVRGNGGDTAAHRGGADVARAQSGDGGGIIRCLLGGRGQASEDKVRDVEKKKYAWIRKCRDYFGAVAGSERRRRRPGCCLRFFDDDLLLIGSRLCGPTRCEREQRRR